MGTRQGYDGTGGVAASEELGLPGGWLLRRPARSGCRGVELVDPDGTCLAALRTDTRPALTIEQAWRGLCCGPEAPGWWALAIGRAEASPPLSVTFTGRRARRWRRDAAGGPVRTVVEPLVEDGLWVAAVPGLHFAVTCRQGTHAHVVRRIERVPGRWRSVTGQPARR